MNSILLPVDFSDCSEVAMETAFVVAKKTGARIVFLHSLNLPITWSPLPEDFENFYPEVQKQIDEVNNQLAGLVEIAEKRGLSASHVLTFDDSFGDISKALEEKNHDLVVLCPHGRKGMDKLLLGSVTEKIMRVAKIPVLVVKKQEGKPRFKTIVFASGLEEDTRPAFGQLLKFAKAMGSKNLHLVEITTPNNFKPTREIREKMEAFVAPFNFKNLQLHHYNHYNVESGIVEFAHTVKADLIALATHGRSGLSNLFIESIPENLVKYSAFPVLSIRV
ncbi:MAG: universal stress protein [Bacteroidetes bacterium]|nr:MAG: universal stress protein [Bacteroidota bacterium]